MPSCTSLHFKLPVFGLWDNQEVFVHRISPPKNTAAFENIESLDLGKFIFLGLKHLQGTWWNIYKIQVTVQFMAWSKNLWTSPNKHFELWRQVAFRAYLWHAHRFPEPKRLREFKENVYRYSALHMPPWPIWPVQVVLVSVGSVGKFLFMYYLSADDLIWWKLESLVENKRWIFWPPHLSLHIRQCFFLHNNPPVWGVRYKAISSCSANTILICREDAICASEVWH